MSFFHHFTLVPCFSSSSSSVTPNLTLPSFPESPLSIFLSLLNQPTFSVYSFTQYAFPSFCHPLSITSWFFFKRLPHCKHHPSLTSPCPINLSPSSFYFLLLVYPCSFPLPSSTNTSHLSTTHLLPPSSFHFLHMIHLCSTQMPLLYSHPHLSIQYESPTHRFLPLSTPSSLFTQYTAPTPCQHGIIKYFSPTDGFLPQPFTLWSFPPLTTPPFKLFTSWSYLNWCTPCLASDLSHLLLTLCQLCDSSAL